jgi:hypothetical protein
MSEKKQFRIVELPATATGAEIEAALNAVSNEGYYMRTTLAIRPEELAIRAMFSLRQKGAE